MAGTYTTRFASSMGYGGGPGGGGTTFTPADGGESYQVAYNPIQADPNRVGGAMVRTQPPPSAGGAAAPKSGRSGYPGSAAAGLAAAQAASRGPQTPILPQPPPYAPPPPQEFTNESEYSPWISDVRNRWLERLSADPTKRAIDRSNLATMDAAALAAKDLGANIASRGALGSGAGSTFLANRVFAPAQREAAGKAADISLGRERDLDNLTMAGLGIARAGEDVNLANKNLGLNQYIAQNNAQLGWAGNQLNWAQLQQQAQDAQMAQYLALLNNPSLFE